MDRKIPVFTLVIVCFSLLSLVSQAFAGTLEDQRKRFLDAEKALELGRTDEYRQHLSLLQDYPLYPYLEYQEIRKNISLAQEGRILNFLEEYASTPLAGRLRQEWTEYLAKNNHWDRLVRDFRTPAPQALQCSYARALLETGNTPAAWNEAENLWLFGRSRPKQCDPVFNQWREQNRLSSDLVWHRIQLAIDQGQAGLARYLGRYLSDQDRSWLNLWLKVLEKPSTTLEIDWNAIDHPAGQIILTQGMGKLIREDTPKALAQWEQLKKEYDFRSFDTRPIDQEIGLYLALRKHPQALKYLQNLPDQVKTPALREWHIRSAIYAGNWSEALAAWEGLDRERKNSPRWTYWKARALEQTGQIQQARILYQSLTGRQNYFSLLASDRLNQPYDIPQRAIVSHGQQILALKNEPGIARAVELFHLDRMPDARREWNLALSGRNSSQLKAAAVLAHDLGWQDRAIIAAAGAGEYDDLVLRFPLSYHEYIFNHSRTRDLNPVWVFALARQESMFMPDVGSPAGALGVMQIMPGTGRMIASMMGESFRNVNILLCPETSIRFGTFYLSRRLQELQNNPVLATAAYNAGIQRIKAWLPQDRSVAADVWVENIPFFETRDYVEKVFTYKAVYNRRLGLDQQSISSFMPEIRAGDALTAEHAAD